MKNSKITSIIIYLSAVICFICSAIWFSRSDTGLGVAWICIGIAFMISGTIWKKRSDKNSSSDEEKK